MDTKELERILEEITFQALKLEEATKSLKELEDIKDIKKHIADLKNIDINTSEIEDEIKKQLKKISIKLEDASSSVDLNELDEINEKIKLMNKKIKPFQIVTILFITIFSFSTGYLLNIYKPIPPITQEGVVIKNFKNLGMKIGIDSKNNKYIVFPKSVVRKQLKNGQIAFIKKEY